MAAKLAKIQHGGDRKSDEIKVQICTSIQQAANQLDVGRTTVAHAKTVLANGSQELIEAVEQGKVAVSRAWAAYEKAKAKERQQENARRNQPQNVETFPPLENTTKSRDAIGARVGVSGRTVWLQNWQTLGPQLGPRLGPQLGPF